MSIQTTSQVGLGLDKFQYKLPDKLPYLQTNPVGPEAKGESFSKWLSSNQKNLTSLGTSAQNLISASQQDDSTIKTMGMADAGVDAAAAAASMFGPVGMAVGSAMKLTNSIGGSLMGTSKDIKDFDVNKNIGSGFGGTTQTAQGVKGAADAYSGSGLAGKLFGGSSLKKRISDSNARQSAAANLSNLGQQQISAAAQSQGMFGTNQMNRLSGNQYDEIPIGKKGFVLKKKQKFQNGGLMKSVIVNGELHARKHELKTLEEFKDADITNKGIPVISKGEGGQITQECEVEKNELILTKDITDKLNKLFDKNDEESQIEAGKLLAYEIMKNTIDSKDKVIKTA